ncbi:MAG: nuclear transport factor 2 family protein [Flavobacteriaceae bacterium]|nr:nuclear transport factor 2 family protein [Flavobacteriaceae bacterium]
MKLTIKNISAFFLLTVSTLVVGQNVTSAGKIFQEGKDKGKTYILGSDKSMNVVLESMKAYNSNDAKKDLSFYSDKMIKESSDFSNNWHKSMKSLNQQPFAMFPLRIKGSNEDIVFSISQEEREWKNGSKQKLYLFEMFTINKAGKISDFKQFQNLPSTNEFGLADGGKIYLKDSTATFTFSNRGEVETIEKMAVAFNKLDGEAYSSFFADSIKYYHSNGTVEKFSKKGWVGHLNKMKSANWKINGILPFKISDTDPVSGIIVRANMNWVMKDGSSVNRDQFLQYSYDLNGKITSVNSFGKDINPISEKEKMAKIKEEIISIEKSWDNYYNAGDFNNLITLYADDALRLPSNQTIITGKAAILKDMEEKRTKTKKGETNTSETTDVFGDENTVTEVGRTIQKDASGKVKSTGKYITIWKKVNGKFVTVREMWNDDVK